MAITSGTPQRPKTTSTSPRKCSSSAATLGRWCESPAASFRRVAAVLHAMRASMNRAAKNVWRPPGEKIAVATALKGSASIRDAQNREEAVPGGRGVGGERQRERDVGERTRAST